MISCLILNEAFSLVHSLSNTFDKRKHTLTYRSTNQYNMYTHSLSHSYKSTKLRPHNLHKHNKLFKKNQTLINASTQSKCEILHFMFTT